MQSFLIQAKKYLEPLWLWAKSNPRLASTITYFQQGTLSTASFLLLMLAFVIWIVLWGFTPMILSNFSPVTNITGEELAELKPNQWQRYRIETDGAVPIGIRSWFEQREFGVITSYRSDDSYWGVYLVDEYYIYFESENEDNLVHPPETLVGRLGQLEDKTLNRIHELIPDIPDTVLPLHYHPQSAASDISNLFTSSLLAIMLLGMAWFFHNETIKRRGGQLNSPIYQQVSRLMKPIVKNLSLILNWIWKKVKALFSTLLKSVFRSFTNVYQNRQGSNNSNDGGRIITIDPSKIRRHDDD